MNKSDIVVGIKVKDLWFPELGIGIVTNIHKYGFIVWYDTTMEEKDYSFAHGEQMIIVK